MVRANYNNISKGIYADRSYLISKKSIIKRKNELKNRDLHISSSITNEDTKDSKILNIIQSNSHITSQQFAKELNVSIRTVKSILKTLVDNKVIVRKTERDMVIG